MSDVIAAPLLMLHTLVPFFLLKCKRAQILLRFFLLQCKRDEKRGVVLVWYLSKLLFWRERCTGVEVFGKRIEKYKITTQMSGVPRIFCKHVVLMMKFEI